MFSNLKNKIMNLVLKVEPDVVSIANKIIAEVEHKFVSAIENIVDVVYNFIEKWHIRMSKVESKIFIALFGRFLDNKYFKKIIDFYDKVDSYEDKKEREFANQIIKFIIYVVRKIAYVVAICKIMWTVDEKLHVILVKKEKQLLEDLKNFLRTIIFHYYYVFSIFYLFFLILYHMDISSFSTYRDALVSQFPYPYISGYLYYFFCLVSMYGFSYYLITYLTYKYDNINKFFLFFFILFINYVSFYLVFINTDISNAQLPDITALLYEKECTLDKYNGNSTITFNFSIGVLIILIAALLHLVIIYYLIRNIISTVSELLIDYMDPEHDMVIAFFYLFVYFFILIFFFYLLGDISLFYTLNGIQ
jgi:hypothetical protein